MITFAILGVPAPQGSKTAIKRGDRAHVIEGGSTVGRQKHRAWREAVTWQSRQAAPKTPIDGPVKVTISFRMPMPQSRPAHARRGGYLWHSVKPDLDKLIRSTLDGIADGGVIVGDSRVAGIQAVAIEVTSWTGAIVQILPLTDRDASAAMAESTSTITAYGLLEDPA